MISLSFRPFRFTLRVWRFMVHTAPTVGGRRIYAARMGGRVHLMRLGPRPPTTPLDRLNCKSAASGGRKQTE